MKPSIALQAPPLCAWPSSKSPSVRRYGMVVLLLLIFFAQLAFSSRHLSLTSDEPPNLGVGYTYLTTGETWYIPSLGHPPLLFAWMAIPVALGNPDIPVETLTNWHTFPLPPYLHALFPLLGPVEQLEVVGRVPMMLLGVLLGGLVFRWAADLFGYKGGLLALGLMVFDPTMIAHTPLATGDLGITLIGFAMFFVGWRWMRPARSPAGKMKNLRRDIVIGLLGGATLAAKVSGFIWVGLLIGIIAFVALVDSRRRGPLTWRRVGSLVRDLLPRSVVILAVAFLFLWGIYWFRIGPVRVGSRVFTLPASDHWQGLVRQMERSETRVMFLAGEAGVGGWWWYFPLAFLIKNPIPLLLMWMAGLVLSLYRRSLTLFDFLLLLAFPVVYMAASIYSGINIGYRHLLPIHPFLYVLAAHLATALPTRPSTRSRRIARPPSLGSTNAASARAALVAPALGLLLGAWYAVGTLSIFPHYLAYFNELVGGPRNGYRYLVDSNLDWGQSFKTLREELDRLDVRPPLRLSHYWYAGPELYGVEYDSLPPLPEAPPVFSPRLDPPPGTYVFGATVLYSGPGDLEQYEWFKHHSPLAQPGYAMFVYRVDPPQPPATWIAQCVQPAAPLSEEVITREFHTQPLRRVYFDCTQSWVYPEDGEASGWYALHDQVVQERAPFTRHLGQAHLAYDHHQYDGMAPAFELYEFRPGPTNGRTDGRTFNVRDVRNVDVTQAVTYTPSVRIAPVGMSPNRVAAERPVITAPVHLEGPLDFLGYHIVSASSEAGDGVECCLESLDSRAVIVETWWQVAASGVDESRPLSIMGHVVDGEGRAVAVADGLGMPVEIWEAGDVIVQFHTFSLGPDLAGETYWLQTGAYWLDTLERHRCSDGAREIGDRILLGEVRVVDD